MPLLMDKPVKRGIVCIRCGGWRMRAMRTYRKGVMMYRRRRCKDCEKRGVISEITTTERPSGSQ